MVLERDPIAADDEVALRRVSLDDVGEVTRACQDRVEPAGQFFLQRRQFPRKLTRAQQCLTHFHERANDEHVDSRSPDRSPASQADFVVYPTASPHVVFICTARALFRILAA